MFLPGAIYVIAAVVGIVVIAICAILAFIMGSGAHYVAEFLVERTNAWQTCRGGAKDSKRWWFNLSAWAGTTMVVSFIIFVYSAAGPCWAFIKYIGGI